MSLAGDRGGRVELDSTWIHLGPDGRPARIDDFGPYAESTRGREASTRLELAVPAGAGNRLPWRLRATDVDVLGHVNNAAYWHAIEDRLVPGGLDPTLPLRARLDHRHPLDLGDDVELLEERTGTRLCIAFVVGPQSKAISLVEQTA